MDIYPVCGRAEIRMFLVVPGPRIVEDTVPCGLVVRSAISATHPDTSGTLPLYHLLYHEPITTHDCNK